MRSRRSTPCATHELTAYTPRAILTLPFHLVASGASPFRPSRSRGRGLRRGWRLRLLINVLSSVHVRKVHAERLGTGGWYSVGGRAVARECGIAAITMLGAWIPSYCTWFKPVFHQSISSLCYECHHHSIMYLESSTIHTYSSSFSKSLHSESPLKMSYIGPLICSKGKISIFQTPIN